MTDFPDIISLFDPRIDEEPALFREWQQETLPKILRGQCWDERLKQKVDATFSDYTGLDGLRPAFYLGVESCNCEGAINNPFPKDDPKNRAFSAGYRFAAKLWRG
jgi:hypothetical protein